MLNPYEVISAAPWSRDTVDMVSVYAAFSMPWRGKRIQHNTVSNVSNVSNAYIVSSASNAAKVCVYLTKQLIGWHRQ